MVWTDAKSHEFVAPKTEDIKPKRISAANITESTLSCGIDLNANGIKSFCSTPGAICLK
jgi:hypothetical protein